MDGRAATHASAKAACVLLACAVSLPVARPAQARATATAAPIAGGQVLVVLARTQPAYDRPSLSGRKVGVVHRFRPITGARTLLPLLGRKRAQGATSWLHVRLPGRPNSLTGWILARGQRYTSTPWRLVVHLATRTLEVDRLGRRVRVMRAVVGKPATPTPRGDFFVEEIVALGRGEVGAPFALALSARSSALQEFAGGPGQIAVHGVANIGGKPGTAASHGCIRLDSGSITWLADRIGAGVTVKIGA